MANRGMYWNSKRSERVEMDAFVIPDLNREEGIRQGFHEADMDRLARSIEDLKSVQVSCVKLCA